MAGVWDTERGIRTGFEPAQHGFRFANRFTWPAAGHGWRWTLARRGLRLFRLEADALGLCGGMCLAALDHYYAGRAVPPDDTPPRPGSPLFHYLCRRQFDSYAGLRTPLRVMTWMWRHDRRLDRLTIAEFLRLRRRLGGGAPTPLVLIRARGAADPTANHQVLAIGYSWEPLTRRATISLYDPNYPLTEPTLSFVLAPDDRLTDLAQSTGETLRGFFLGSYHSRVGGLPTEVPR
jgi:hypothetical protein